MGLFELGVGVAIGAWVTSIIRDGKNPIEEVKDGIDKVVKFFKGNKSE
jgi:hypothetical protein